MKDGGPAFPCEVGSESDGYTIQTGDWQWMQSGMSIRDYFAAKVDVSDIPLSMNR